MITAPVRLVPVRLSRFDARSDDGLAPSAPLQGDAPAPRLFKGIRMTSRHLLIGALLVASLGNTELELGDQTRVQYDRCAIQMALATIDVPRAQPFSLWYSAQH